ncbi:MAG: imidazolonepropionase [Nitrososphaerota archaeon]|nr:imidazolonepropionase [Nitrososphaerota archaeon]MDG6991202.1 imidazolonepropionase [Nitrososphaerota archaeon]
MPELVLVNAGELVTCAGGGDGDQEALGVIEDGALMVDGGRISWIGTSKELGRKTFGKPRRTMDARGGLVTPGFVDPHTHLVFAGSREDELDRKTRGESYVSILSSGGGIQRTVRDTRKATAREICAQSLARVEQMVANGVTTVETKTGYGQRARDELKMIQAIELLRKATKIDVVSTFLGLHAKPPEFDDSGEYVDYAIREMLPLVARSQARPAFSDCFCEEGIFSRGDCARYLRASRELGFSLKIHADEFADSRGASLAAESGCVSADHIGHSGPAGIESMAEKGVVAVLLPGTSLYSSISYADAKGIIRAGCSVALGTDLSPNSWIESPQFVMGLACAGLKMTPAQALLGFTANAAKAISRADVGSLRLGNSADFVVHSLTGYRQLPYRLGGSYVRKVIKEGREVYSREV